MRRLWHFENQNKKIVGLTKQLRCTQKLSMPFHSNVKNQFHCLLWAGWLLIGNPLIAAAAEDAAPSAESGNAAPAVAEQSHNFDLLELRVKGNTFLDKQSVERTVYPFLGKQKNLDAVEKARQALENLYHSKGYQTISVDIPEQNVVNGVVNLQVVEGKISRLRVTDSRYFSLGEIKEKVPALAEGSVPNMPQMQEQLAALAKQSPDRTVTPVLRAGDTPGTLEVDLKVKDELPLHGKLELNGRNTSSTDRLRMIASMHYDNLWQKFHSASFMYQTSPENNDQVQVFVGSYALPIFDSDKRLAFYVINSASNINTANGQAFATGASSTIGSGSIYGMRFVDPIATSIKNYYQTFTAGMTYKDQSLQSGVGQPPLLYNNLPFLLGYSGNLQGAESLLSFNLNANMSFSGVGNSEQAFKTTSGNFNPNFLYLNGGLSYTHNLPYGMEFAGRFNGQAASTPLQAYERMSIGGQLSVRGYYETQLLTDQGMQASLEWYTPKYNLDADAAYNKIRGLVFLDGGAGWKIDNPGLSSQVHTEQSIASAGAGFRMQLWKLLTANFDVGVPFVNQVRVEKGNPRLHFQVYTEF